MKNLQIIVYPLICCFLGCFNDGLKGTFDYSELKYDSNRISVVKWDASNPAFPNNSSPLALSQFDIQLADSLIGEAVLRFNQDQKEQMHNLMKVYGNRIDDPELFLLDLKRFKIEYFPYHDVNGRNIIDVNCVCDDGKRSKKY